MKTFGAFMIEIPHFPWMLIPDKVARALRVDVASGLDDAEVAARLDRFGPNRLKETKKKSLWILWINQFKSFLVGLLAGAAVLSFFFGDWIDSVAIFAVIVINACIGFFTELQAVRSIKTIKKLVVGGKNYRRNPL